MHYLRFHCLRVFLRPVSNSLSRAYHIMDAQEENTLAINTSRVTGMKVLDKEMFEKTIKVHCYFFENKSSVKALKVLKPYLIKLPHFKSIREGHEKCCRVAYLDPEKIPDGFHNFTPEEQAALKFLGFPGDTAVRTVTLTYENYTAAQILRAVIPPHLDSVTSFSTIGHIIHLNLRPEVDEYKSVIGQVLLDKGVNAKTVVTKTDNIESTFRNFKMELIAGVEKYETDARENKCKFRLDFSKVYWNPRLSNEHWKVACMLKKGDVLIDVFCGIGPFVIPAAKKKVRCFANDLNPAAIDWLEVNIKENKVSPSMVSAWCMDGERFIKEIVRPTLLDLAPGSYRVLVTMNLPALAPQFFASFKGLLTPDEHSKMAGISVPVVRVYCFVKCPEVENHVTAKRLMESHLEMALTDEEIECIEFVRNVAPNKDMMCVKIHFLPGRSSGQEVLGTGRVADSCRELTNRNMGTGELYEVYGEDVGNVREYFSSALGYPPGPQTFIIRSARILSITAGLLD